MKKAVANKKHSSYIVEGENEFLTRQAERAELEGDYETADDFRNAYNDFEKDFANDYVNKMNRY